MLVSTRPSEKVSIWRQPRTKVVSPVLRLEVVMVTPTPWLGMVQPLPLEQKAASVPSRVSMAEAHEELGTLEVSEVEPKIWALMQAKPTTSRRRMESSFIFFGVC